MTVGSGADHEVVVVGGGNAGISLAARLLRPGGQIGVEHDDTTSAATADVFARRGAFDGITARRDLTGRPRFVTAVRS